MPACHCLSIQRSAQQWIATVAAVSSCPLVDQQVLKSVAFRARVDVELKTAVAVRDHERRGDLEVLVDAMRRAHPEMRMEGCRGRVALDCATCALTVRRAVQ